MLQLIHDGWGVRLRPITLLPDCNLNHSLFQLPSIGRHRVDVNSGLGVVEGDMPSSCLSGQVDPWSAQDGWGTLTSHGGVAVFRER